MKLFNAALALMLGFTFTHLYAHSSSLQADSLQINLRQALGITKDNYPLIKVRRAQLAGAELRFSAAKTQRLPDLYAMDQLTFASDNGLNGTYFGTGGLAIPTSGSVKPSNTYQGTFGSFTTLLLNWNIYDFGRVRADISIYRNLVDESRVELENEIFQQQVKVADAYLLLLIDQKLQDAQQKNLERAAVFLRVVRAGAASGLRPGVDTSIFKAEYSKADILLLQTKGEVRQQQNRLENLMGVEAEPVKIDTSYFNSISPVINSNDSLNYTKNPLIRIYQSQIDLSRARSTLAGDSWLPQLSFIGGTWGRGSGIDHVTGNYSSDFIKGASYQTYNYLLGLTLSWNITELMRRHKLYKASLQDIQQNLELYRSEQLNLNQDFKNAQISAEISQKQAEEAPVQLLAAKNAYAQADARYRSGLSSIPELAQAFYLLNRAEVDQLIAINNLWRSLLLKSAASGDLNIFLNQLKP